MPDESLGDDKSLEQILDDVLAERRDEGRLAPLSQVFSSGNNDEASQPRLLEHERNPDRRLR